MTKEIQPTAKRACSVALLFVVLTPILIMVPNALQAQSTQGTISTFAGGGGNDPPADGSIAIDSKLRIPHDVATDSQGNVFFTDKNHFRVLKVTPTGQISTIAGTGGPGQMGCDHPFVPITVSGDGGRAIDAALSFLTRAGTGSCIAGLTWMYGIAIDPKHDERLYFSDRDQVRFVNLGAAPVNVFGQTVQPGYITTVAGNGYHNDAKGSSKALDQGIAGPAGLAVDDDGNLLISDFENCTIKKVDASGDMERIVGLVTTGSSCGTSVDGRPAVASNQRMGQAADVAIDPDGNIFIASMDRLVEVAVIEKSTGNMYGFAGKTSPASPASADGGKARGAEIGIPGAITTDRFGNVFISDYQDCTIRMISSGLPSGPVVPLTERIITTVAGASTACTGPQDNPGVATSGSINQPVGLSVDPTGRFLYMATVPVTGDPEVARIRKVDITGPLNPVVNTLVPDRGPVTGGYPFAITGNLLENATVTFGGAAASPLTTNTKTEITGRVPRHLPPGPVPVAVTTEIGGTTVDPPKTFTYHPALTALSPPSGRLEGGDTLTIFGLGFTQIEKVRITTTPETIINIPPPLALDDQLTITTPPHPQGGEVRIFVTAYGLESIAVPAEANIFTYKAGLPQKQERNPKEGISAEDVTPVSISGPGATSGGGFSLVPGPAGAPSGVGSGVSSAVSSSVPAGGSSQALDPSTAASSSAGSVAGSTVPAGAASGAPAPAARMQLGLRPVLGDANDSSPDAAPEYQMTGTEPSLPAPWFAASIGLMILGACFGASISNRERREQAVKYQAQRA